jgi:hypothetical protein
MCLISCISVGQESHKSHETKSEELAGLCCFLEAPGESGSWPFSASRGCMDSLAFGCHPTFLKPEIVTRDHFISLLFDLFP